jgi:hypothetical protein
MKTTPPIAPDPYAYGAIGSVCAVGVMALSMRRGDVWLYTLMAVLFTAGGFAILNLTAHRNYKRNLEAWRLRERAQLPMTQLDPGSVYTIDGVLSTRTANGGWLQIGSGVATFHFKPDRQVVVLPPRDYKLTEWRRKMMERESESGTDAPPSPAESELLGKRPDPNAGKKQTPPTRED